MSDFDQWVSRVSDWTSPSSNIPLLAREDLVKARIKLEDPKHGFTSLFEDPLSVHYVMGYKDRKYSLSYDILKKIPSQLSIVAAILQTRCNQVASFSVPFRLSKSVGYVIKHKNPSRSTTKGEREMIQEMEKFIYSCGYKDPNPHNPFKRDDFETFLKKVVRDSLMYDQMCHPEGTRVTLRDGTTKNIEEIEAGDYVISHDGKAHKVLHPTQRLFSGNLVTIKARATEVTATSGHPLFVLKNKWAHLSQYEGTHSPEWIPAGDVEPGMYLTRPRVHLPETNVQSPFGELTESLAFVMGLYVAEGNCIPTEVRFTFHEDETDLVAAVQECYGAFKTRVIEYTDRAAVGVRVLSRELAETYIKEFGTGSASKRLPEWLMHAPKSVKAKFLAGYLSGDGHLRPNRAVFSTTSRALFDQISTLCNSLGIFTSLVHKDYSSRGWSRQYSANLSGSSYRSFAAEVGFPVDTSVPVREPALWDDNYFYIRVNEVSRADVVDYPVYNMEVEDTHSYIANGYTSHNCFEVVPDRRGTPYEFMAVDASTIRLAAPMVTGEEGMGDRELPLSSRLRVVDINSNMFGWGGPYRTAAPDPYRLLRLTDRSADERPAYVQVHNGQIWNVYTRDELAFGVRNPRTDIYIQGYGQSELEMLIQTITAHLYAEEYNRRFFMQGTSPKGMLSFKGDSMTPDQLEVFRRQWRAQMEGVQNSWKTPIFQSEQGIEWIPLDRSNAEMEYSQWMEYLIKVTCGVFLIDPAELNFDLHGGVSQTPLFESSQEWKLKASRDRGLKPLLRFIAKQINENIVEKIDDHFIFDFVGLDELTEMEKHELRKEQVSTYMTLNEIRRYEDLPALPDGDIPMNPTYIQAMTARQQAEQMEQMSGGGDAGTPGQQPAGSEEQDQGDESEEHTPQYSDTFTKALKVKKNLQLAKSLEDKSPAVMAAPKVDPSEKYLEISLDDFISEARR